MQPAARDFVRRWLRRLLPILLGANTLFAFSLFALLHSLDRPWLKHRIQSLARDSAGVEIDYRAARIALFSGAELEGLSLYSPAEMRAFAPELVHVERVSARWSLATLVFGGAPRIERILVSGVRVNVVVDEHGRSSFDALARPEATPSPSVPLSQKPADLLGGAPPIGRIELDDVALSVVRTAQQKLFDRSELRGLAFELTARSAAPAERAWHAQAGLGSPQKPLELAFTRAPADASAAGARARFWLTLDASSRALHAALDLRMLSQSFAAGLATDHFLHVEATARFDPNAHRTAISVDRVEAGDGAARLEAALDLPDRGDPKLEHAQGELDLARLLSWLPLGLAPLRAESARMHFEIDSLALGPDVDVAKAGAVSVEAELSKLAVTAPASPIEIGSARLALHARPAAGGGLTGRASLSLSELRLAADAPISVTELTLDAQGQRAADGAISSGAEIHFARAERGGASTFVARDGKLELHAERLHVDRDVPIATQGELAFGIELAALDQSGPRGRTALEGLNVQLHSTLEGHAPYAAALDARATLLELRDALGNVRAKAPARIELRARDVRPELANPAASCAVLSAVLELGALRASLEAKKEADAADFALEAKAKSLGLLRPWLPPSLKTAANWDAIGFGLRSSGRAEHLSRNPTLREQSELTLERFAFENVTAQQLDLHTKSQGDALEHDAELELRAQALRVDAGEPHDDHVVLAAKLDRRRPALELELTTEGRARTHSSVSLAFDPSRRALSYAIDAKLAGLAPLAPFAAKLRGLGAIDLAKLELALTARGSLLGVVASVARDGTLTLEPNPARSAELEGTSDLRIAGLRWTKTDTAVIAPDLHWKATVHSLDARRVLDSELEIGTLHVDLGSRDIDLNGVVHKANVAFVGNLVDPEIDLKQQLAVHAIEQTIVPEYPLGELTFALEAERGADGVVHVAELTLDNRAAGTTLAVTGNLDLAEGRRTLSVTTKLAQDLARISTIPERLNGHGKLEVEANVTSPDLAHYRVRATVKGENVSVKLARQGLELETANGEVPITIALEVAGGNVLLERTQHRNPYSMLRFADQHPLLTRSGFLSIAKLKTPFVTIEPLVGNLEIEQNVISLRQFEMGVRGGSITGQCGIDWNGLKSTLELHVRANGVKSSHGEPFDGNIAVVISAADRTIDGRAEVLRIGERHLLDLLDLQDPMHVDPAMNRIRTALGFGYPKSMRLIFDHGFASAHLELGGLAQFVSIGELRGIPMGPIVDRMIARMMSSPDAKETP